MKKLPAKEDFLNDKVSEPLAVRLAGLYDIWDKRDPNAELFQHGLRADELTDFDWKIFLDVDQSEMLVRTRLAMGRCVSYAKTQENAGIINAYGFALSWEGIRFLACNHARFNSLLFTAGLKPEHEACLGFNWDGQNKHWRVSLYHAPGHEHLDLSKIAVKHGGGGHRGAAGMMLKELPFLLT